MLFVLFAVHAHFEVNAASLLPKFSASANSAKLKKNALKAYREMLSSKAKLNKKMGNTYQSIALSKVSFALAYIDNDDVPELIVNGNDQYLFTYRNNKVKLVYAFEQLGNYRPFGYYKRKSVFRGYEGYHYVSLTYFSMKNGKKNMLLEQDAQTGDAFDYMGRPMSMSKLSSFLKKKCGNKKLSVLIGNDFKKNTSSNRKRFLK